MSKNLGSRIACWLLATVAGAVFFAPAAEATPITYNFTVNVTSGPISGNTYNGNFSYDSSSVTPGTQNNATGLLTALNFTFNGTTYTSATANTGWLGFNSSGDLISFNFGNVCFPGTCSVTSGYNQFYVLNGTGGLAYSNTGFNDIGHGDVSYALAIVNTPEPNDFWMMLFGLGVTVSIATWTRFRSRRRVKLTA